MSQSRCLGWDVCAPYLPILVMGSFLELTLWNSEPHFHSFSKYPGFQLKRLGVHFSLILVFPCQHSPFLTIITLDEALMNKALVWDRAQSGRPAKVISHHPEPLLYFLLWFCNKFQKFTSQILRWFVLDAKHESRHQ